MFCCVYSSIIVSHVFPAVPGAGSKAPYCEVVVLHIMIAIATAVVLDIGGFEMQQYSHATIVIAD